MSLRNASYNAQSVNILEQGEHEHAHQGIYDFFPNLIFIYDVENSKIQYANNKLKDVLGFSHDDLRALDYDLTKLIFKDDLESTLKELKRCGDLKDDDSHIYKCRFNCKEEDWRHFHVTGKVLKRKENGDPASFLFVAQDVTEKIKSSEEARNARELMNETEELMGFGSWTWSLKTDDMTWSKGMYALLGYEKRALAEITGSFYQSLIVEEDFEEFKTALQLALENKTIFEKEYSVVDSHNNEKRVHSKARFIVNENNEVTKLQGITRCITEHSQLHISLSNYRELVLEKEEFLGQGSWEMNYADKTMQWSDGMYRLFGYDPVSDKNRFTINEDLYKKHVREDEFLRGINFRDSGVKSNTYMWEYEIRAKDGTIKKLETHGKILHDRKGKPTRIIGTTRDITQLRNYERELQRTISELKRSNKDLEDFAYIASHDIQEPLRKITSFSERLKTKYSKDLDDEARKYLERIMVATRNARLLIDGLMDFSRLTSEGQLFEKIDLNTMVQEIKTELELKIEETDAVINHSALPVLEVVPVQMKQLFANLLLNAIKFKKADTPPLINITGRRLSRNETVEYKLNPLVSYYEITIEDNGIGFEDEYAEKIFEMFQRLHSKADYPGAGIGLALCKKITENHGGVIFAKSTLSKGTTFSVILPETQY